MLITNSFKGNRKKHPCGFPDSCPWYADLKVVPQTSYKHCSCAYEYVINPDYLWNTT